MKYWLCIHLGLTIMLTILLKLSHFYCSGEFSHPSIYSTPVFLLSKLILADDWQMTVIYTRYIWIYACEVWAIRGFSWHQINKLSLDFSEFKIPKYKHFAYPLPYINDHICRKSKWNIVHPLIFLPCGKTKYVKMPSPSYVACEKFKYKK